MQQTQNNIILSKSSIKLTRAYNFSFFSGSLLITIAPKQVYADLVIKKTKTSWRQLQFQYGGNKSKSMAAIIFRHNFLRSGTFAKRLSKTVKIEVQKDDFVSIISKQM